MRCMRRTDDHVIVAMPLNPAAVAGSGARAAVHTVNDTPLHGPTASLTVHAPLIRGCYLASIVALTLAQPLPRTTSKPASAACRYMLLL